MKHTFLLIIILSTSTNTICQTLNMYYSIYSINIQRHNEITINNDNNLFTKLVSTKMAFGLTYQKTNNITYFEFIISKYTDEIDNKAIDLYSSNNNLQIQQPTYGVIFGKGKRLIKKKKITVNSSIFFRGTLRSLGINQIQTTLLNTNDPIQYYHKIRTIENPNQTELSLGLRIGLLYHIFSKFYFSINFDFTGSYTMDRGTTKDVTRQFNYYQEVIDEDIILKEINSSKFISNFFIPNISIGYYIWKSKYER